MWYSVLLLGYKPVQHVTVLNTVGDCNTMVSIIIYYILMGPPSYMRSVVDRNVVMRRIPVFGEKPVPFTLCLLQIPHGLAWVRPLGFRGDRPATNRPFDGTATRVFLVGFNIVSGKLARLSGEPVKFLLWIFNGYSSSIHHPSYGFHYSALTVLQWRLSTDTHDCLFFI
jgi:hypothetical protein